MARSRPQPGGPDPAPRHSPSQGGKWWKAVLVGGVLIILIACAGFTALDPFASAEGYVTFTSSTGYESAVRTLTDLGIQLALPCTPTALDTWRPWAAAGQQDIYPSTHRVWVAATPLASAYWPLFLHLAPGVVDVLPHVQLACGGIRVGTPPPGVVAFIPANQAGTYLHVTFASPLDTYDTALYAMEDLGLRLADPCYERSWLRRIPLPGRSLGQETAFSSTHTLILATTRFSSTDWQAQVRAVNGVVAVAAPFTVRC